MKIPMQITSRSFPLTEAVESLISEKAAKLDAVYDRIIGCRVFLEIPHRHLHQGKLYNVRIALTVPGSELVIDREAHEDLYAAVRDAFGTARRRLEEFARRQRGEMKVHAGA